MREVNTKKVILSETALTEEKFAACKALLANFQPSSMLSFTAWEKRGAYTHIYISRRGKNRDVVIEVSGSKGGRHSSVNMKYGQDEFMNMSYNELADMVSIAGEFDA